MFFGVRSPPAQPAGCDVPDIVDGLGASAAGERAAVTRVDEALGRDVDAASVFLMSYLPVETWERLALWLAVGLAFYFLYGVRHSRLAAPAL
jgi:hypothetical protein